MKNVKNQQSFELLIDTLKESKGVTTLMVFTPGN